MASHLPQNVLIWNKEHRGITSYLPLCPTLFSYSHLYMYSLINLKGFNWMQTFFIWEQDKALQKT